MTDGQSASGAAHGTGSLPTPSTGAGTTGGMQRSLELVAKIRAGTVSGCMLAPADRQQVVSLLAADGLSTPEIAQVLQVADRTIDRDRRAIRESLAVAKDPRLVEQMVGRLMAEAELCVQRIRRTVRKDDVDPAVKVDAEHRCFEIVRDFVQSLQRLGYLPTATQKVETDLTHHVGELPSLTDLQAEIERLARVPGGDHASFKEVEQVVARAALASRVKDIVTTQEARNRSLSDQEDSHDSAS